MVSSLAFENLEKNIGTIYSILKGEDSKNGRRNRPYCPMITSGKINSNPGKDRKFEWGDNTGNGEE
jgi:hypothetical protein